MKSNAQTKLLAIITAVVTSLLLSTSCKDDDEKPGSALIGTWEQVSVTFSQCLDSNDNGVITCTSCDRMVITENTVTFEGEPAEPYTATNSTISFTTTLGATTVTETVNYVITGTTLTITFKDDASDGGCLNTITFIKV